jgi:betaine reductase
MEKKPLRVVHYLNQFFGGIGGEDKASLKPQVKEGPVGPGKVTKEILGNRGEVVATVICGDNYFAEHTEEATHEIMDLIHPYRPDAVLAGPAFNAGRYGIACGAVCKAAQQQLNILAVTGMYKENPGVDLFRADIYIIESEERVKEMHEVISKMVGLLSKIVLQQKIGRPSEEGYFPRGLFLNDLSDSTAAQRVVSMLLAKVTGQPFQSEVPSPKYDRVNPAPGIKDLHSATIALVTDGGLVPKGNPDSIEPERATRFGKYSIRGVNILKPQEYEVTHAGYTPVFVNQDPHRLVAVDVMRDLEKEGLIGKLHETFYSTAGCASIVENVKRMGQAISKQLKAEGVSGVILTST